MIIHGTVILITVGALGMVPKRLEAEELSNFCFFRKEINSRLLFYRGS